MRRLNASLPAAALAAALLAAPAGAQGQPDDLTFFETVDVKVVNVEVVVTGPDGAPVRGLEREDFELLEDGRPVEITNFYRIDARPSALVDPAAPIAGAPRLEPAEQQLHLGIFVDGLSLQPSDRRRVLDAIRDFFNYQAARPTSLTLAGFDGNLSVESMPTFDPDRLNNHLQALKRTAARGSLRELDRRTLLRDINDADITLGQTGGQVDDFIGPSEAQRLLTAVEIYAQQRYDEARLSTDALESVVEALAGLPGRKALLYVSGGLARNPGEAMFSAWQNKFSDFVATLGVNVASRSRQYDTTPEINRLIRFANSNRVTFYSIGAGRSGTVGGISGEDRGFDGASLGTAGGGRIWTADVESIDNSNLSGTLDQLAAATGGLSMTSSRNFDRLLGAMNRDLGAYYSLGYTPSREPDDKVHKLAVRVKGDTLEVRHRESYREQSLEEIMTGRTRSAALLGTEQNPLDVALEFGRAARQEKKKLLVPVMVKIPLSRLVLVPQEGVHVGRVGIYICTCDRSGRTSPVKAVKVPIRIPEEQLAAALDKVAGYRMLLLMRPEEHAVAVAVRDDLGRTESTISDLWNPRTPTS